MTQAVTTDGELCRYRVFLGRKEHWFGSSEELDAFVLAEEKSRGRELQVADSDNQEDEESEDDLQVHDLHEIVKTNSVLRQLKDYGIQLSDLVPAGNRNGEPYYPFEIQNEDGNSKLSSLRDLPNSLRKMGERGLRITRFKGLGEMDPEELWETSMDASNRLLLQVTMEDAGAADEIFRVLMGDHVEPRREFIEKHAQEVTELDV